LDDKSIEIIQQKLKTINHADLAVLARADLIDPILPFCNFSQLAVIIPTFEISRLSKLLKNRSLDTQYKYLVFATLSQNQALSIKS
jgi:hypothetical protein